MTTESLRCPQCQAANNERDKRFGYLRHDKGAALPWSIVLATIDSHDPSVVFQNHGSFDTYEEARQRLEELRERGE